MFVHHNLLKASVCNFGGFIFTFAAQIALRLEHEGSSYVSELLVLPALWQEGKAKASSTASEKQTKEGEKDGLPGVHVALTPVPMAMGPKEQQMQHVSVW